MKSRRSLLQRSYFPAKLSTWLHLQLTFTVWSRTTFTKIWWQYPTMFPIWKSFACTRQSKSTTRIDWSILACNLITWTLFPDSIRLLSSTSWSFTRKVPSCVKLARRSFTLSSLARRCRCRQCAVMTASWKTQKLSSSLECINASSKHPTKQTPSSCLIQPRKRSERWN